MSLHDRFRRARFESLENRLTLSGTQADIVFLVDESGSGSDASTRAWLSDLVAGTRTISSLSDALAQQGITDVRYGLVGFGEHIPISNSSIDRYAHSQLFDFSNGDSTSLFGDPTALTSSGADDPYVTITQLATIFGANLRQVGGREDGWDALEHTIAEYPLREGAVPIFVLIQNDEGRIALNDTLTHEGVLAALQSKNAILNVMVAGDAVEVGGNYLYDWEPLVNLVDYGLSSDIRILGIEADAEDGVFDRLHNYHWIDTNSSNSTNDTPVATSSDALQVSFNGSGTGLTGMVGSGRSVLISDDTSGEIGPTAFGYAATRIAPNAVDMASSVAIVPGNSVPFNFPFYGSTQTTIYANEDGTITFDAASFSGTLSGRPLLHR